MTGHFTSYKTRPNHELATRGRVNLAYSHDQRQIPVATLGGQMRLSNP
jgi:hypothetical protein